MSTESEIGSVSKDYSPAKILGLIVNPIAGMGGAVGLKGTDGKAILEKAIALGAKPVAATKAERFLLEFKLTSTKVQIIAGAGTMGEIEAQLCGFGCTVIGEKKVETSPDDTKKIAMGMVDSKADLLVFCGGDGTARDLLEVVNKKVPVLGVPTGVKMHSAIFAVDPEAAAHIAARYFSGDLSLREAEIMDINENAFRKGRVSAELYGYFLAPYEPYLIQEAKVSTLVTESELRNQAAVAVYMIESMEANMIYIIGPGTTTRTIGDLLDTKKTLLGVDVFINKKIVAKDVSEKQILQRLRGKRAKIIVTPIGGQGFIFGRGNQQISSKVIWKVGLENIIVIGTNSKIRSLKSLRVDTGDHKLDNALRSRRIRVVTDYKTEYDAIVE